MYLIRKQLEPCRQGEKAESELLFLLGSIRHPNIVELLASYTQEGISSLIFNPADCDLHDLLLSATPPKGFEERFTYLHGMRGLAEGLSYLHNFGPRPREQGRSFLHGCHHDIKPRNILVRGTSFILADFGFAKLKGEEQDSQTLWKNTTFEYGAPECRDPDSFAPGPVGRALDIWSLGCVFSEIITYFESGAQGVADFRSHRNIKHTYGQTRCFHDEKRLAPNVARHLETLENDTRSNAVKQLIPFLRSLFSVKPKARPSSEETQRLLSKVTMNALTDVIVTRIQWSIESHTKAKSSDLPDSNLYTTQLQLQKCRLLAWVQALGVSSSNEKPWDQQLDDLFNDLYSELSSTAHDLQAGNHFENAEDNLDFILNNLAQANRQICKCLSKDVRKSLDDTFRIVCMATSELQPLQRMADLATESEEFQDIKSLAAVKYMKILLEKHENEPISHSRIDESLIREAEHQSDPAARPKLYLYQYGFRAGQERPVIVEPMPYWLKQHDTDSEEFLVAIQGMFRRVQELVAILKFNAKPAAFRTLDCLGAFHNPDKKSFGVVYAYPWEDTAPVRLNNLLRHGKKCPVVPGLDERLDLAKILVASVQSFHTSGWLHKNISSLNVLFFLKSPEDLSSLNMREPYVVGFDHSRKDGDEYTQGITIRSSKEYLHPDYRLRNTTVYRRSYDFYALGLLLLEIGRWSSLSNTYGVIKATNTPQNLREEYMKLCTEDLGKIMGPIYMSVTRKCLEYNAGFDGVGEQLQFQEEVVDKLNRCAF